MCQICQAHMYHEIGSLYGQVGFATYRGAKDNFNQRLAAGFSPEDIRLQLREEVSHRGKSKDAHEG